MKNTKQIIKITSLIISSIGLLYIGLVVYVTLSDRGPLYLNPCYNTLITRPLAWFGNAEAQYKMGSYYALPIDYGEKLTDEELEEAIYWFGKAAERGNATAQFKLGRWYANGWGVEQDYEQAVYWWQKAAEQGNVNAQFNLGLCYAEGEGVKQDMQQAVYWWQKAAERGNAMAQFKLGQYYANGWRGVKQDYEQAVYWYRKAAEQGDAKAQFDLGFCYANGNGVALNYEQAMEWLDKAAEQGHIVVPKGTELVEIFENLTFLKQCTLNCGEWSNNAPMSVTDRISFFCIGTVGYESIQPLLGLLQVQLAKTNTQQEIVQNNSFALALDTLTVKKYGLKFKNGVILDFAYSFIYPTENTPEINRIRDLMIQDFFSTNSTLTLPEAIKRYEKTTFAERQSQLPNNSHQHSQQYSAVKVMNNRVLIHMMQGFYDWGGVHGVEPFSVGNYDLCKGEKITLTMLFAENTESELSELIKNELDDYPYNNHLITENFILLPKGILFVYKPYDIASYAMGTIGVPLSYKKIKHLLTPSAHAYFGK